MKKFFFLTVILFIACAHFKPAVFEQYEVSKASEKAAGIYERGNKYFKDKDYKNTIIELSVILDKYAKADAYEPALYMTAFSYYKLNKYKEAAAAGEKLLKEFPGSTYFLNAASLVGESYYKLGQDYKASYYLIKFFTKIDDSEGRKKAFERIIKSLPELTIKQLEKLHRVFMADAIDEHILFYLAQIEAREGKKKEAKRDFNLLMRRFPNTVYTYEIKEYKKFIDLGETSGRAGILLPLTGKFAEIGQRLLEIVMIFEKNKSLPFSMHFLDTKSDPVDATIAAAKLIEDLEVDFLIAPISVSSGEAFSVSGFAYGKGIPVILPMTSDTRFESIPLIFTSGQSQKNQAKAVAQYNMYDRGISTFAILYPDMPKYKAIAETFAQEVVKNNREVLVMVKFDPDSITLKWEIKAIKEKKPQAIFLAMDENMIINSAPQIAYYGLERIKLLGIETFNHEKVPRLGEKYVEGAVFAAPAAIDSSALKAYTREGLKEDDFSTKFFYILWRLKELKNYNRNILREVISDILKGKEIFNIYQIKEGEFVRLTEMTQ